MSSINRVIGVVSGKGGVGKSLVTSLLAVSLQRKGYHTAILDADITGPSIPKIFGVHEKAKGNGQGILPVKTESGVDIMSINLLLEHETDPVVWRGPVIATTVKQFWTDVIWQDVDYMFVDMPPGTGDVPLTVYQSLPLDGIVIVTSPQDLVSMIVGKAVKMAQLMDVPVIGVVENMSYVECPDCGKKIMLYGEGKTAQAVAEQDLSLLAQMPIDPKLAALCDAGKIGEFQGDWLDEAVKVVENFHNWDLEMEEEEEKDAAFESAALWQIPSGLRAGGYLCLAAPPGRKRREPMRILVDADACPVKGIVVEMARQRGIPVLMVTDTSHRIQDGYSRVITVDKGRDSADLRLANEMEPGDIVVTQDFGVAALALGKGCRALNQNGLVFTGQNMDQLLFERYVGQKVRRAGRRTQGPGKRTAQQDAAFRQALAGLLPCQ